MAADDRPVGDLHVATVVVNVQDMRRAVRFWSDALGYERREEGWDDDFLMLVDPTGRRIPVSLQRTGTPPMEPVRVHIDLYTSEQAGQVDRLLALGATRPEGWSYPEDPDFVVLRDTEGNEFCVIDHAEL